MKDFLKYTLATIVGLMVTGIVMSILGIVSLAGFLSASQAETSVKKNSVFVLQLKGNLSERSTSTPLDNLLSDDFSSIGLDDVLSSIRKAKEHKDISGIYFNPSFLVTSFASLQEIRDALVDFKESGKFLVAYADQYTAGMYYLASVADKVIVNPSGTISWHGLSSQPVFYKDLLAKVGVEMQIFKVGTYKSAVEPFIATEMSPANREQVTAFLGSIWGQLVNDISVSRNIPADSLNAYADRVMDLQPAETYIQNHLADTLLYQDGVLAYLKKLTDTDEDDKLETLTLEDMIHVKQNVPKDKSGNIIAVYYAFGEIDNPSSASMEGISSAKVVNDLRKLREDEHVKAVVLRVNSPGGSAYGSEQMWREVNLLKAEKPVIVSMGDYAASGGYYMSCAADYIVAEPTTLTGSIGIFGMIPNMEGLLTDKLGLHFDVVKTNQMSDFGSLNRPFSADERALMQNYIENGYKLFINRCAAGRKMSQQDIGKIAEGRVWTGRAALELGLVDELGGLARATEVAVERAGVEHYTVLSYPEKEGFLSGIMNVAPERYINSKAEQVFGSYYNGVQLLRQVEQMDQIQARMPFDLNIR